MIAETAFGVVVFAIGLLAVIALMIFITILALTAADMWRDI